MSVASAIAGGAIGGRLWFYTNYHCNLACRYCLTESKPDAPRRLLPRETIEAIAHEAADAGFTSFGVTGGEPFLRADMVELLEHLTGFLPTVVLTNGTLFTDRLLASLAPLQARSLAIQLSLDSAEAEVNDRNRAEGNFASVVRAIERLVALGFGVRIGSTVDEHDPQALERLCALHRSFGIAEVDHVVRPIIRKGRAETYELGQPVAAERLPAELTLTADGAFCSPAAPTMTSGEADIGLLLTRTIKPLAIPAAAMLRHVDAQPSETPALRISCA